MDHALQEHNDHENGCYQNESQAAFEGSRIAMARIPDPEPVGTGDFNVVVSHGVHCSHTDAFLGYYPVEHRRFEIEDQAQAFACEQIEMSHGEYDVTLTDADGKIILIKD